MKKVIFTSRLFIVSMLFIGISLAGRAQRDSLANAERIRLSKTNENHQLLASLTGTWSFTGRHLPPNPNIKPVEVGGTAERKAVMDGRYFIFETTGGKLIMPWSDGKEVTYKDMTIEGYDNVKKKFFNSRIANHWGTGIVTMEGSYDPATRTITYEGEMDAGGAKMKFLNLIKIADNDHYTFEAYNFNNGVKVKVTEVNYVRTGK